MDPATKAASEYKEREEVNQNEQHPIDPERQYVFKVTKSKDIIRSDNGSAKAKMDKKLKEWKESLKRRLDENTAKLARIKKMCKQLADKSNK